MMKLILRIASTCSDTVLVGEDQFVKSFYTFPLIATFEQRIEPVSVGNRSIILPTDCSKWTWLSIRSADLRHGQCTGSFNLKQSQSLISCAWGCYDSIGWSATSNSMRHPATLKKPAMLYKSKDKRGSFIAPRGVGRLYSRQTYDKSLILQLVPKNMKARFNNVVRMIYTYACLATESRSR
jgi:hypothetical protein